MKRINADFYNRYLKLEWESEEWRKLVYGEMGYNKLTPTPDIDYFFMMFGTENSPESAKKHWGFIVETFVAFG